MAGKQQSVSSRKSDQNQNASPDHPAINVAFNERLASILGGGILVLTGFRRRSTFGAMLMLGGGALIHRGATGHCNVYSAMGKNTAEAPSPEDYFEHGVHVEEAVTVSKPAAELYRFWRQFENLPRFMQHLESVQTLDEKRSRWVAAAPAGQTVEWVAEIINDEPDRLIAWRSTEDADVHSAGSVRFVETPDGGTQVTVNLDYLPPAGQVGHWIAKLFGEAPDQQIRADLQQFKQVMESGERSKIEAGTQS